jgi:hypothetical protein
VAVPLTCRGRLWVLGAHPQVGTDGTAGFRPLVRVITLACALTEKFSTPRAAMSQRGKVFGKGDPCPGRKCRITGGEILRGGSGL